MTLVRSLVPHESDNILVNFVEHRGTKPLKLRIETCSDQFAVRAEPFEVAAGLDAQNSAVTWNVQTHVPPDYNDFGSVPFRMWARGGDATVRRAVPDGGQYGIDWARTICR